MNWLPSTCMVETNLLLPQWSCLLCVQGTICLRLVCGVQQQLCHYHRCVCACVCQSSKCRLSNTPQCVLYLLMAKLGESINLNTTSHKNSIYVFEMNQWVHHFIITYLKWNNDFWLAVNTNTFQQWRLSVHCTLHSVWHTYCTYVYYRCHKVTWLCQTGCICKW